MARCLLQYCTRTCAHVCKYFPYDAKHGTCNVKIFFGSPVSVYSTPSTPTPCTVQYSNFYPVRSTVACKEIDEEAQMILFLCTCQLRGVGPRRSKTSSWRTRSRFQGTVLLITFGTPTEQYSYIVEAKQTRKSFDATSLLSRSLLTLLKCEYRIEFSEITPSLFTII